MNQLIMVIDRAIDYANKIALRPGMYFGNKGELIFSLDSILHVFNCGRGDLLKRHIKTFGPCLVGMDESPDEDWAKSIANDVIEQLEQFKKEVLQHETV